MTGLREAKSALRTEVLLRRDAMSATDRSSFSGAIIEQVLDLPAYREAGTVLAYASFGSELETGAFLRRILDDGKVLLLPKVHRVERRLRLYTINDLGGDLEPGAWGIREPREASGPPADPRVVDFALVPGVAFDRRGGRLGYGGGFYDALISDGLVPTADLISGAFECQVAEKVPRDERDMPVHLVITEAASYPAGG